MRGGGESYLSHPPCQFRWTHLTRVASGRRTILLAAGGLVGMTASAGPTADTIISIEPARAERRYRTLSSHVMIISASRDETTIAVRCELAEIGRTVEEIGSTARAI